ncbi:MAG: BrnT family toxin [Deltaproteobacteria bacterium]|nr:BrnT family toxin [Deltaproteobacteria bacterium]MBW2404056.1 BrnT family toxin [Deltaproteobacteria bacterium]MBW2719571.1 BrnT family toxin [Deltaproteobacteria bacterium]
MRFEWDPAKNDANQRKHGLRFEDAKTIFLWASHRIDGLDDIYAGGEERFISIAPLGSALVTVVWMSPRAGAVRIISARAADKRERERYRRQMDLER